MRWIPELPPEGALRGAGVVPEPIPWTGVRPPVEGERMIDGAEDVVWRPPPKEGCERLEPWLPVELRQRSIPDLGAGVTDGCADPEGAACGVVVRGWLPVSELPVRGPKTSEPEYLWTGGVDCGTE